jgi:uncharacterized protein (TIGR03086 family)
MDSDQAELDRRAVDRRALDWAGTVIAEVRPSDLAGRTPCGSWTLRELLGHMIAHNHGFAAAVRGTPVGGEVWDSLALDESDIAGAYAASADSLTSAEAWPHPDKIEVYGFGAFGLSTVLGMHIVDFVVHGWDVARSIGSDRMPDDDLSEVAYGFMQRSPRQRPNRAFDVIVPIADDAPIGDKLMAFLGRDPNWRP